MTLHPLAQRFAGVANEYERGRPDYPRAVIGALGAELELAPGGAVLDLGAGTGKLSRALLAGGFDVTAVEPLESLQATVAGHIGAERAIAGVAEAIPIPDASVDAVTVADAFHWFDQRAALTEIRRVLRPHGGLAILSTVPDWRGASWAHEVGTLVMELRPEHPHFDGPPWQDAVRAARGWSELREIRITVSQPARAEQIVNHMGSMSWIAAIPDDERTALLERIRGLIDAGETPDELPIHFMVGITTTVG
jgi:SAM-dependent methyltransferase